MALWGQGDPRWIVEERPDSTNVNNWHWTERDATNWSKAKLKELFLSVKGESDEGKWHIDEVKSIDGEATINNRKGKLIYFYEWTLKLSYKGTVTNSDSKNAEKLKQLVRKQGIDMCKKMCGEYIRLLAQEYSSGMVLPTKQGCVTPNSDKKNTVKVNKKIEEMTVSDKKPASKDQTFHTSINTTEEFRTTADELFLTLTDPQRISAFTGSPCQSTLAIDGNFSIMNDNITGTYVELMPNNKIVEKWRFKEWPEGVYSTVTIELEQQEDSTLLKLHQTGVPDYDTKRTEEGWKRHFWGPIKQVFGYGAQLF